MTEEKLQQQIKSLEESIEEQDKIRAQVKEKYLKHVESMTVDAEGLFYTINIFHQKWTK
jgi:hypothetical protein